jgi:hypothetical protein
MELSRALAAMRSWRAVSSAWTTEEQQSAMDEFIHWLEQRVEIT